MSRGEGKRREKSLASAAQRAHLLSLRRDFLAGITGILGVSVLQLVLSDRDLASAPWAHQEAVLFVVQAVAAQLIPSRFRSDEAASIDPALADALAGIFRITFENVWRERGGGET